MTIAVPAETVPDRRTFWDVMTAYNKTGVVIRIE